ncbi:MAG: ribosomal protein S18-alanine N-acetyltransferase [Fimbriimonadaceae bacterium]
MAVDDAKKLRIEELSKADIDQIVEIERKSHGSPWSRTSFENEMEHRHGIFLVAKDEGEIVGYGGLWLIVDEAHVINVVTHPDKRRAGTGQRLMEELLLRAKEEGAVCSTLEVRAGNEPAIKLYEKLGYVTGGRRKHYYPDNHEDALVMWLNNLHTWEPPR